MKVCELCTEEKDIKKFFKGMEFCIKCWHYYRPGSRIGTEKEGIVNKYLKSPLW